MKKKKAGTGFGREMNIRKQRMMLELFYILMALVIVILAVFAFLFQEKAVILFPIIFSLAAIMNITTAVRYARRDQKNHRHIISAVLFFVIAAAFLAMAVVGIIIMM